MRLLTLLSASLLAAALLTGGCAQQRTPYTMVSTFDEADYLPYTRSGDSSLAGQAFLRQKGGGVVTCAGSTVILFPATAYTREAIFAMARGSQPINTHQTEGRLTGAKRESRCDAQGKFAFSGLPSGLSWFVATEVKWQVGYAVQGGALGREMVIGPGANEVLLAESDFLAR